MDKADIIDGFGYGYPMVYVINASYVSENATELSGNGQFTSITILNGSGGIVRKG